MPGGLWGREGIRWRDAEDDWGDSDDIEELAGEDSRVGALDQTRSEQSDLYSFDEDFERVTSRAAVPAILPPISRKNRRRNRRGSRRPKPATPDPLPGAVRAVRMLAGPAPALRPGVAWLAPKEPTTWAAGSRSGVGLILLLVIAYAIGPKALGRSGRPGGAWRLSPSASACCNGRGSGRPRSLDWWPPSAWFSAPTGRVSKRYRSPSSWCSPGA